MNDFVKNKIRAQNAEKKPGRVAPARKESPLSGALAKIVKKAGEIAELMTGQDVEDDLRVLREAKKATHRVYDAEKKALVNEPDHKIRLAATTLSRAYHEGKPIERQLTLHGDADNFAALLKKFQGSPEAMESLPAGSEVAAIEVESEPSQTSETSQE